MKKYQSSFICMSMFGLVNAAHITTFVPTTQMTSKKAGTSLQASREPLKHDGLKEGEMFNVCEGPGQHLIDVDRDEMESQDQKRLKHEKVRTAWLTFAWALFLLPIFIRGMFEFFQMV